jgi:16S rRNA processing protein RimM
MSEAREFIKVGQIVAPHGLKGGVRVTVLTDFLERFDEGAVLYIQGRRHTIKDVAWHKGQVRLHLSGVRKLEEAEALKWAYLEVPKADAPTLEEGQYMTKDLIGLRAIAPDGTAIGVIEDVQRSPAQDLLVVAGGLVPAVKEFVKDIDLKEKTITLALIPGMLPEEDEE